mgnify:CR=1 FL=1
MSKSTDANPDYDDYDSVYTETTNNMGSKIKDQQPTTTDTNPDNDYDYLHT